MPNCCRVPDPARSFTTRRPVMRTVVAAVLRRNQTVLLCHRRADREWYGGVWDLPGGHVEPDESAADALRRELAEELGIDVATPDMAPILDQPLPSDAGRIIVHTITNWSGTVHNTAPEEHDELRWWTASQLAALQADEVADQAIVDLCLAVLRNETDR